MSLKGGYVMVDCQGLDLGDLGAITGLYDKVKRAITTNKPIILNNVVNGTQKFTPIVAFGGVESSTSVFLSFVPVTIHINSSDVVSI